MSFHLLLSFGVNVFTLPERWPIHEMASKAFTSAKAAQMQDIPHTGD